MVTQDVSLGSSDRFLKTPDGTLLRYQYGAPLTVSDVKPRILILPGRATSIESFKFVIQDLRERGYGVWVFDWRGQGLSSREAGRKGYVKTYDHYIEDLDIFVKTFLKNNKCKRPLVALGQSMGAHIGLRYMAINPGLIDAAVFTAPMLDLNTGIYSKRLAVMLCNFFVSIGLGKNYVFSHAQYDPVTEPFEGNLLTHDREAFYYSRHIQTERPELVLGSATYGWVKATIDSIHQLMRKDTLAKIKAPIKIYAADDEKVVDNARLGLVGEWVPNCEIEVIPDTRHQLLSEQEPVLERIYNGLESLIIRNFELPIVENGICETESQDVNYKLALESLLLKEKP